MSDVDGYQAIIRELDKDLIGKNGIDMLAPKSSITYEMMHIYENFIGLFNVPQAEEPRDKIIKARDCADGRPHREYVTKLELSSLTVKTHLLLLSSSCLEDAIEERKIVVENIIEPFY